MNSWRHRRVSRQITTIETHMNTRQAIPLRRTTVLGTLGLLLGSMLGPAAGAQSERASTTVQRVTTQCWILIGGDEFKQRFESIGSKAMTAGATETRALLIEAERTDLIAILAQPELESADQAAAKFSTLVEVPLPRRSTDASGRDRNLFIELLLTPQVEPDGKILLSLRLDLKALTPSLPISETVALNGPRSISSKVLLDAGDAIILNLSSNDTDSMTNPTRPKGEDLLMLLAPKIRE